MSIKIYPLQGSKGFELLQALDEKGINYETSQPTTEWIMMHKVRELPMMEVDGKLLDYSKAVKWIKKQP